ncbi:MAG TPA: response regulator transcription factor [Asanoa sp.]
MRVLLCNYHILLAEVLAHVLTARGREVVAVARTVDEATAVLREHRVDVLLLDVASGVDRPLDRLAEVRRVAAGTSIVLLAEDADPTLIRVARAAGASAIADKHKPVNDIIGLLDRVYAGEPVWPDPAPVGPRTPTRCRRATDDVHRLAAFLTPRERQVLSALVCGGDTRKVARSLGIATATARCHIQCVLTKMGAHSRLEVATAAVRHGMVDPKTGEWLIAVR